MKTKLSQILSRLKNPTVVLSIASHLISFLILMGYKVNEGVVMAGVTIICSILVTLGILSNPDYNTDNRLFCTACKEKTHHVEVADRKVCNICGKAQPPTPR